MNGQIGIYVVKNEKVSFAKYKEYYSFDYDSYSKIPKLGENINLNSYDKNLNGIYKVCEKLIRYDPVGNLMPIIILKVIAVNVKPKLKNDQRKKKRFFKFLFQNSALNPVDNIILAKKKKINSLIVESGF